MYVPALDYRHHYSQSSLTDPIVRETDLTLTASETKLYLIETICFSHKNHSRKQLAFSGDFFLLPVDILQLNGVSTELCVTSRNYFTNECQKFDMIKMLYDWFVQESYYNLFCIRLEFRSCCFQNIRIKCQSNREYHTDVVFCLFACFFFPKRPLRLFLGFFLIYWWLRKEGQKVRVWQAL